MELPDQLLCLFSGTVERHDGRYVVELPPHEIEEGAVSAGEGYRVAVLADASPSNEAPSRGAAPGPDRGPDPGSQPVSEGDRRDVEIDDIGDQGDGIARVERGFVVIVPDTDRGERVTVEITDVRENVAFAEVLERLSYYD